MDEKVMEALMSRENRIKNNLENIHSSLIADINTETEAFNNFIKASKETDSLISASTKTNRSRAKLENLKKRTEAYRKYFGDDVSDRLLSAIHQVQSGYITYLSEIENKEKALNSAFDNAMSNVKAVTQYPKNRLSYVTDSKGQTLVPNTDPVMKKLKEAERRDFLLTNAASASYNHEYATAKKEIETAQAEAKAKEDKLKTEYENLKKLYEGGIALSSGINDIDRSDPQAYDNLTAKNTAYVKQYGYNSLGELEAAYKAKKAEYEKQKQLNYYSSLPSGSYDKAVKDDLYVYINSCKIDRTELLGKNDDKRKAIYNVTANDKRWGEYKQMSDREIGIYNYLYETEGKKAANEFLSFIKESLKTKQHIDNLENLEEFANKNMLTAGISSVLSVPIQLCSAVEQVGNTVDYLFTGELERNNAADYSAILRQGMTNQVDIEIGNWDVFDFVYNTTMSGVDSLVVSPLGPAGGIVLGFSAAASTTNDIISRGGSVKQAFWGGLASGLFEGVFEAISLGKLSAFKEITETTWKEGLRNFVSSVVVNGSEEGATEIANILWDVFVNKDISNYKVIYDKHYNDAIGSGLSAEEARKQAKSKSNWQMVGQVVEAIGSGALMGGGFAFLGKAMSTKNAVNVGKIIAENKAQNNIIELGLSMDDLSVSYKMADKIQNSGNMTNASLGKLAVQMLNEVADQKNNIVANAVSEYAAKLQIDEAEAKAVASYFGKAISQQSISNKEYNAVKNSDFAKLVAKDLQTDAEWVSNMKAELSQVENIETQVREAITLKESPNPILQSSANQGNLQNSALRNDVQSDIINNNSDNAALSTLKYSEEQHKSSIMRYKSGESYMINAKLREGMELEADEQEFVDTLNEALQQLPTYEGTVYRNLVFDDFGGKQAFDEFVEQYTPGDIIVYDQFISCSTEIDGYPVEGDFKVQLIIESKTARDVDGYGNNMESEVLYSTASVFIVDKVKVEANTPKIYLKEAQVNGYDTDEEQSDAMFNMQESHSRDGNLQSVSESHTVGNLNGQIRSQSTASAGQRDTVRSSGRQETVLSTESQEQIRTQADSENGPASFMPENDSSDSGELHQDGDMVTFGGIDTEKGKHLDKAQQDEIKDIGKKLKQEVVFEDFYKLEKFKGKKKVPDGFLGADGKVHINYYAKRPVQFLLKHEITHYLKRKLSDFAYQDFMGFVLKSEAFTNWMHSKGFASMTDLKKDVYDRYSEVKNFNEEKCYDEILADFVGDYLFGGENAISQKLIDALAPKQKKTFMETIKDILAHIKQMFSEKARLQQEIIDLEDRFLQLYNEAVAVPVKENVDSGEVFSIGMTEENNPVVVVNDDILKNAINEKDIISIVKKSLGRFKKVPIKGQSIHFLSDTKNEYVNSRYSRYLKNNDKQTYLDKMRLAAHPQDIVYATTDYINEGLKHPRKDNIVDFARGNILVDISGRKYSAEVVIGFTKSGICELHDIVTMLPANFEYKKEATSKSMDSKESTRSDVTSNNKIPHEEDLVNNNFMQENEKYSEEGEDYSIPADADAEYMSAVENGNIETAQRLVDEAAKNAGYTVKAYHGTSQGGFTVFDTYGGKFGLFGKGSYFTENKDVADSYQNKGKGNKKQTYSVFLSPLKVLDMDAKSNIKEWQNAVPEASDYFENCITNEDCFRQLKEYCADEEMVRWEAEELITDAISYNMGYNTITHIGGGRFNKTDETRHRVYIVFDPSQIKSADPVTYDDNGNVIPLSERFNSSDEDIRYSIPAATNPEELLEAYENGEISRQEYLDALKKEKALNPVEIARLTKEDANTTPKLKKKTGVSDGDKVSKFYDSVLESDIFDLNFKAEVATDTFVEKYTSVTNKETLKKAAKELDEGGRSYVSKWWATDPAHASLIDTAVGFILMDRYQRIGDYDSAAAVTEKVREFGTAGGQQVQIFSILGRLNPETMAIYAQRELDKAYEIFVKDKSQKWIDKNKDKFKLTEDDIEFIRRNTMQAAMFEENTRPKAIFLAEIAARLQDKIPPQKGDSIRAFQRNAMLLNLKTNIRNVSGNAGMVGVFIASDVFGSGIDKMVAKKTGVRTTGNFNFKSVAGLKNGLYESYDDFKRGIRTKQEELDRFDVNINHSGKSFNDNGEGIFGTGVLKEQLNAVAKALNKIDNFTSFCLEAGDRPFFEMWYMNSLNKQKKLNNVDIPTSEMLEIAKQEALQRTWQDNNTFTRSVSQLKRIMNNVHLPNSNYGLGDFVLKFVKTPSNLAKAIIEFSPVGFYGATSNAIKLKNAIETDRFTPQLQKEFVRSLSNAITGTLLYTLVAVGAALGLVKLSGDGDDDKDASNFEKYIMGIPPYSIEFFGVPIAYDWMQPFGSILATVAEFMENRETNPEMDAADAVWEAICAGGKTFTQQSFLQSMYEFFSGDDAIDGLVNIFLAEPAAFVPQALSQVASFTDRYRRTSYDANSDFQTAINKVMAKIPGLRTKLPKQVNALGEDVKNPQYFKETFGAWEAFASPWNTYPKSSKEVVGEIYKLYKESGENSVMPRMAPNYIEVKGNRITFASEEKADFQRAMGDRSVQMLAQLFDSKEYSNLTDKQKVEVVGKIYSYAYARAKSELEYNFETLSAMEGNYKNGQPILTKEKYEKLPEKARKQLAEEYFLSTAEVKYIDDYKKLVEHYIRQAKE